MPQQFLLRMEGVNLGAVLSDTNQISVIRGGSLLLRQAVNDVQDKYQLQAVSVGASVGLFSVMLPDGKTIDTLLQQITNYLSTDDKYQHLTFVVDALAFDRTFQACREKLIGMNRLRQLQQVSCSVPDWNDNTNVLACTYDGLRPIDSAAGKKVGESVSTSVARRFEFGRKQRQRFYCEELGQDTLANDFTDDLQTLSADESQSNLHRKIALIYLDGNSFGKIQQKYCTSIETQQEFDKRIRELRRSFLRKLVKYAETDPSFCTQDDDPRLRLEVLMWGGDEMLLVVPAWKGIDTLQLFYSVSQDWKFKKEPLTHAGGIVFSQANTPIYRLRKLAEDLANGVKAQQQAKDRQPANLFDYLILESMDFPAESLESLRKRQFGDLATSRQPLLPFSDEALSEVRALLSESTLPRSQLISLAYTAIHKPADVAKKLERLKTVLTESSVANIHARLQALFGNTETEWPWLHLAELWDYLLPAKNKGKVDA
ncbi:Cas10/Cmr2 second palm domain-containing protein [Thiothrix lacustris]|uniref:Cas10/Cmr2 second palm domain-containing protein n=1 Tax=Thiothrix lacustris TaxID=525917 RepID=UPI0027E4EDD0|nr:hypothetical protein [Thiothrix lacustris]WMP17263.1 hypothetical protein RCS87_18040 [Thiothrix lacustris]